MNCPKCGYSLPDDSVFCQYCGTHLDLSQFSDAPQEEKSILEKAICSDESVSTESASSLTSHSIPHHTHTSNSSKPLKSTKNNKFCKKCGAPIDCVTKKCTSCGKQYFRIRAVLPSIIILALLIVSIILNATQYFQGKSTLETAESRIEELEKTVASQKSSISSLEDSSGYFNTICDELRSGNIGYAANNFKASESIIVVGKNETSRKFTLTANWTNGGNVSVNYSGYAAKVSFDNDSWTTSTKMSVEPWFEGVTAVTFSNDVDSNTFKILIIVTD